MSARKKQKTPRKVSRPKGRAGKAASRPASQRSARKPAKASRASSRRPAKPERKPAAKASGKATRKPDAAALKKQKEKERLLKEKALLLKQKEREKEQLAKQKEKERLSKLKEKERLAKDREKEQLAKQKEKERLAGLKEKERLLKEKQREQALKEKEKERLAKQKEKERLLKEKERVAQKEAAIKAREAERERQRLEKEAEREELRRQKDAEREELRRQKEAERARRDAEREAYRKAKEAERERLRAEREAARRALEGKVARASKRAQRADGLGRGAATTRVYRPDAIPDQSGTTRRAGEAARLVGIRPVLATPAPLATALSTTPMALAAAPAPDARPTPPPPPSLSVEERWARISQRLEATETSFQREYRESFDMSWIYHDSALEGVVYTFQELKTAVDPAVTVVPDSSLQPVCEEIRRNRQAIELVRELAEKRRVPLNVDIIKKLYVTLHPEEGDVKTVKYRKDIPQHRLYFHEYAPPDKIAYKVRQVVDWLNGPEPKKMKNPLRVAARVHYDLLRAFPFQTDSGKAARLLMNVILMRAGYPPAIIHSTERQKYYEALKGQLPIIIGMVNDAITNALLSIEKRLEDYEARGRS